MERKKKKTAKLAQKKRERILSEQWKRKEKNRRYEGRKMWTNY